MRKKHKNEIFHKIKELGFTPDNFTLHDDVENELTCNIKYKDTPFVFSVSTSTYSYNEFEWQYILYAPGFPISEVFPERDYSDFSALLTSVNYWINNHIKEFEVDEFEPDLWSEFKNGNNSLDFNIIDFNDKGLFSAHEKKQISMSINELKLLINKKFETTIEEQKLISERLEYLIDSTKNSNKFDWKSLVLSTIIGIATTLTLDVEKGKLLFELFRQAFTSVRSLNQ
jgi:hypothetical protein